MLFEWTDEQSVIFDAITATDKHNNPSNPLIIIDSVAGSSKTTTVVEASKRLIQQNSKHTIRTSVFGKSNALELEAEMPKAVRVSTIYSLAYSQTVRKFKLKTPIKSKISKAELPPITTKKEDINYLLDTVTDFLTSRHTDFPEYVTSIGAPKEFAEDGNAILNSMLRGTMSCTHDFYLKLFHKLLMDGKLQVKELDTFIMDEAGDLTVISLDIFANYPAKQRIAVGDDAQSIYAFLDLVSAFDHYKNEGLHLHLTKSFRVNRKDAVEVEKYCQTHIESNFKFIGMDYTEAKIETKGYITRTNANLINKMVELNLRNEPYRLPSLAKIHQIFSLTLTLMYLRAGNSTAKMPEEYHYLQHAADKYGNNTSLRREHTSLQSYIMSSFKANPTIISNYRLIISLGGKAIKKAYDNAKIHQADKDLSHILLTNAFISKGMTMDQVELDDDLNKSVLKAIAIPKKLRTKEDTAEVLLGYIVTSRHRHTLLNCKFL